MALLSQCGVFTSPASTGNQIISLDSGIWGGSSPKCVLIWAVEHSSDTIGASAVISYGAAVSSSSRAVVSGTIQNGIATSNTFRKHDNANLICLLTVGGANFEVADLVSFGADQFTINWSTINATAWVYNFLALGGSDLSNVALTQIQHPVATGNQATSGLGFQPDCLHAFGIGHATAPPDTDPHFAFHLGAYDGTNHLSISTQSKDAVSTSQSTREQLSTKIIRAINTEGAVFASSSVSSLDADGFTLNWDTVNGTEEYAWILSLKGPQVAVGIFNSPTSADTLVTESIGFKPKCGLLSSFMGATSASVEDHARIAIGAFDSDTNNVSAGAVDEDGQSTTDADRFQRSDRAMAMIDHAQAYTDTAIAFPDGTDLKTYWDNADATAREVGYLVLGDTTDATTPAGLLSQAGVFTSPAATDPQQILLDSGIWGGESPKCVLIWHAGHTADAITSGAKIGFGVATSSSSRGAMCSVSEDSQATSDTDRIYRSDECIVLINYATAKLEEADFVSFGADQLTINWSTIEAAANIYNFLAIGGDELSNATTIEFTSPASTGNTSYTGVGFQPDAVLIFGTYSTNNTSAHVHGILAMGYGTSVNEFGHSLYMVNNKSTSEALRYQRNNVIAAINLDGTLVWEAEIASLDADGFTLNWTTAAFSGQFWRALCIKCDNVAVVTDTQGTSTGTKSTAIGFAPQCGLLTTFMGAASASVEDHARIGIGALDADGNTVFAGAVDEDGQSTTDADRVQDSNETLLMIDHAQNVDARATGSFSGNNLDLNWTAADATAREWGGLFLGSAAVQGGHLVNRGLTATPLINGALVQ